MIELYPTLSAMPETIGEGRGRGEERRSPYSPASRDSRDTTDIYRFILDSLGARPVRRETHRDNGLINSPPAIFAARYVLATRWNSLNRVSIPHTESTLISEGTAAWSTTTIAEGKQRESTRKASNLPFSWQAYELASLCKKKKKKKKKKKRRKRRKKDTVS